MKSILIFVEENYEELELWYPKYRIEEAGYRTLMVSPEAGKIYSGKYGYPCLSEQSFSSVSLKDFQGIVIPGGFAPDKLRRYPKALELVRQADEEGKMVAFICHGGWVPISAKILKNRLATSVGAIRDDIENAGAIWKDEAVVIDKNLISSRTPKDLPLFGKAIIEWLKDSP